MPYILGIKETSPSSAFELASITLRMRIWADQEHAHLAKHGPGILRISLTIKQKDNGTDSSTGFVEAAEKEGCV